MISYCDFTRWFVKVAWVVANTTGFFETCLGVYLSLRGQLGRQLGSFMKTTWSFMKVNWSFMKFSEVNLRNGLVILEYWNWICKCIV